MESTYPTWVWVFFASTLLPLLALDLFVHRGARSDSRKTAILWSIIWILVGLGFGAFIWSQWGSRPALDYIAAYLIEKSLSLDNLFVFLIIFQSLNIPQQYQRTVLSWGIFGALVFRGIFIFIGAAALKHFHWLIYVFGAILLWAAWKTFRENPAEEKENRAVQWLSKHIRVTPSIRGNRFFVREQGKSVATPLFVAVVGLEITDVMFAFDSVPAAFSVTREEFLVYSSNAFAILGLRALYIVLAQTLTRIRYLHYGLAGVLGFAGLKFMIADWIEIPPLVSIAIIVLFIGASIALSFKKNNNTHQLSH